MVKVSDVVFITHIFENVREIVAINARVRLQSLSYAALKEYQAPQVARMSWKCSGRR